MHQQAVVDPDRAVKIRVGLHTGEVLVDDGGDLFGQHVVMAARIADLASGGENLTDSGQFLKNRPSKSNRGGSGKKSQRNSNRGKKRY